MPVYEQFFRWLGYGEAIDPMIEAWRDGDRQRALEAAPDELVQDIFALGDPATQRARLEEYVAKGVNVPVLLIVPAAGGEYGDLVEALAPG